METLSIDELRNKTLEFKTKIKEARQTFDDKIAELETELESANIDRKEEVYKEIDLLKEDAYQASEKVLIDIQPEAFAVIKETAKRLTSNATLKVQLIGGSVLHQGKIAEMMTGEGKTLVATLPIYLNALTGNGVHVVTVNDYLAKRDAAWMGPLFEFHGLSIDCIDYHKPNSDARRKAYNADITYGTNNEFGFDYLRDNMAHAPKDLVQRPHNYAIIDEVDSVLIDDARTPLIISGATPQENHYMQDNNKEMPKIDEALWFVIDEKNNGIELTDKGIEQLSGTKDKEDNFFLLPDSERIHTLNQLLKAYTLFEKDVEYVIMDNKIKIVDEQTGRVMDGRRYSDGLHQALEAKENVKIEDATQTYATVTLQNYFRMYNKLSGMTGTAVTEAGEFWEIYKLDVVEIPTNKPLLRKDREDLIYKTKREKYNAVIDEIVRLVEEKRPVLVGTTSVEISELLGRMLTIRKIPHNVLNAKLHKKEADIVAEAGNPGVVTIATNMAGRGTDIKLSDEVKASGGLAIVGTERHDSRRVDRQLRGRAGRQGDPGSSQFYVSLEDNLMRLFGSERVAKMMDRMGLKEGEMIQHSMISKSIERAQKKVEENNFGIRKRLLEYDDIMNSQREVVYKRRRHALYGERLQVDIVNMVYDTCEAIVVDNKGANDYSNFEFELIRFSSSSSPFTKEEFESKSEQDLIDELFRIVYKHYQNKVERNAEAVFPVIKDVYEKQGNQYERIAVPFTDGVKTLNVVTNLKEAYESQGKGLVSDFEKNISLAIIDETWKDHLRQMDELKQSVQNASYEQKDPLLVYKFEAFELFKKMLTKVNKEVLSFLFKGELPNQNAQQISQATEQKREKVQVSKADYNSPTQDTSANQTQEQQVTETIIRQERKIGRNERVTIKHVMNGESKEVKFKQAIPLIEKGEWVLVE
ncbi:UNVERIFIED_CONTAM: hypothetical protein GTU68_031868 [Idotea baltica]|nr:hypothetical protein [Idotea baltica]